MTPIKRSIALLILLAAIAARPGSRPHAPEPTAPPEVAQGPAITDAPPAPPVAPQRAIHPIRAFLPNTLGDPLDLGNGPVDVRCSRRDMPALPLALATHDDLKRLLDRWTLSEPARDLLGARAAQAWDARIANISDDRTTISLRGADWVEEFDLLARPSINLHEAFRYTLHLGPEVQCVALAPDGHLEIRDAGSAAWLRMPRPILIDAHGRRHEGEIRVDGAAAEPPRVARFDVPADRTVEVSVAFKPLSSDAYPILIDPVWTLTTSMTTPRERHSIVLLEDWRVLVVGGANGTTDPLNSAEIFDPVNSTWTSTASLPAGQARRQPILTLLQSGKVLLTGGYDPNAGSTFNTAYVWNPAGGGTWAATTNAMNSSRAFHAAHRLQDGRVLVIGGGTTIGAWGEVTTATQLCDLYDPATDWFIAASPMTNARLWFGSLALDNGTVLVAGGANNEWSGVAATNLCEIYTPDAGIGGWGSTGSLASPRFRCPLVRLPGGTAMRVGGNSGGGSVPDCETYSAGIWTATGSLPQGNDSLFVAATITSAGVVIQAGGNAGGPTDTNFRYNAGNWTGFPTQPAMQDPRDNGFGVRIAEGKLLICGGRADDFGTFNATSEIYEDVAGGNTPPTAPIALEQRQMDDVTVIPDNGGTPETQFRIRGVPGDPDSDAVRLQVEIKPITDGFDGTGLLTSTAVPAGTLASVVSGTLTLGQSYLWRARTLDAKDEASPWTEFEEGAWEFADVSVISDTTPPAQPAAPDLDSATDTGISNTDNVTNNVTPTFTGTTEADATVDLYAGATLVGTTTADGIGLYAVAASPMTPGTYDFAVTATDAASNTSLLSPPLSVSIDTSVAIPAAPDLAPSSDLGSSNTDDLTSDTTPTFTGTIEASAGVSLYVDSVFAGSATADAFGAYTVTSSVLTAGVRSVQVEATDPAGNVSGLSPALPVTIETTPPAQPAAPDLTAGSDSGSSAVDDITNDTTPTFDGTAEANALVTLYADASIVGTATANGAGAYTVTASPLAASVYGFSVTATDAAGNVSIASSGLTVTIDTSAATPGAPDLTSDTGSSATDNVTDSTTPAFAGTAEPNGSVDLYAGASLVDTATTNGAGAYTVTSSVLAAGAYNFTVVATDVAGNLSASSPALAVEIDTVAPGAVGDLAVTGTTGNTADLSWTAPGDDGAAGTASSYDVRYALTPITTDAEFSAATSAAGAPAPAAPGTPQAMTVGGLALATTYYFAVKTADGLPNWSAVSNGPSGTTILDTPPTVTVGPSASEGQFLTDGTTAISIGGVTNQNSVVFKVTVNDADGDQVLLEIEVQPVGTPFTDTALATSALAPDGSVITLSVPVGSDNLYHWQARAVDDIGTPGTWASFGGNSELVADFTRDATPPDSAVTTSGALRAATYPGMIQGTATDGAGSVASVAVTVQRSSDTLYWTGAGWGALTWLTATGTTTWAYTFTPADGETYAIQSSATDSAGNPETAFGGSSFTYDTTEPNSTVTTSGMQSSGTYGGAIAGTASDGASGIASVQLSVQRSSDGLYWDGGAWGAAQAWLAAAGTTNWTYGFAPANGATYTVQSRATDGAGNQETTPGSSTFSYNISGPDSAILTSGLYGVAGWTGTISGSATTTGGASVATVEITIQRVSDGLYWTGAAWGAITWLAAGGTTSWSYAFTPADGESYQVQSAATDSFANTETSFGSGSFSYDGATPTSTITTSGTYTAGTWSMMIQGTAADTFSGIGGVDVRVQRTSDGLYWNGLAWTAAPAWLFATGTTSWVLPFTPTELAWYQVESRARDGAGNVQGAPSTSTFMVESLGGSGGTKRKSCSLGARGSGSSWWILALCVFIGSLVRSRHAERTNS